MSFLYPRTISIFRGAAAPSGSAGLGEQPYQEAGALIDTSVFSTTPIFTGIPASIQQKAQGKGTTENLPGDAKTTAPYRIFIPRRSLALGTVKSRDFITDDIGRRYHVIDPYWNSLGYNLLCMILEM